MPVVVIKNKGIVLFVTMKDLLFPHSYSHDDSELGTDKSFSSIASYSRDLQELKLRDIVI